MYQLVSKILLEFMFCFKRMRTWKWFVVLVIGFMLRSNHRGVTSTISALRLEPKKYHTVLHFFRSDGYSTEGLYRKWIQVATEKNTIMRIADRALTPGDHTKISKEGQRMPDVQIIHQESENSGKSEYIEGHIYGHVCAVITDKSGKTSRNLPLMTQLHTIPPKDKAGKPIGKTLIEQMIDMLDETAKSMGEAIIAPLDGYFYKASTFKAAEKTTGEDGIQRVSIVTRANVNAVGFKQPEPPPVKKRGRPKIYGDKVKLHDLFSDTSAFTETSIMMYGKSTKVKYLVLDF